MSLATTCPNCSTCFRVVQDQLRVSEGWVRCGNCQQVFNALESLFDLDAPHEPVGLTQPPSPAVDPHQGHWQTETSARWMRRIEQSGSGYTEQSAPSHPSEREEPLSDALLAALHAERPPANDGLDGDLGSDAPQPPESFGGLTSTPPEPVTDDPGETAFAPYSIIEERAEPQFEPTVYLPAELQPEVQPDSTEGADASPSPDLHEQASDEAPMFAASTAADTDERFTAPSTAPEHESQPEHATVHEALQGTLFIQPSEPGDEASPAYLQAALPDDELASAAAPASEPMPPAPVEAAEAPPSPQADSAFNADHVDHDTTNAAWAAQPETPVTALEQAAASPADAAGDPSPAPLPDFVREADRRARWQRPGARLTLALLGLLLAAGLAAQAAWHWRDLLAVSWPPAHAPLQALCDAFGCKLQAPQRLDALVIDSTALSRPPGVTGYRLAVHLRNRADHPVAVPSFDLVLTDAQGSTISRRMITADAFDFHEQALSAQAEAQWTLEFVLTEGSLVGYSLAAFYP